MRYRTDYILGSYRRIFQNVAVRDLRHNSDHYMVMGCLRVTSPREHSHSFGRRTRLPLRLPGHQTRTQEDTIFAELRRAFQKWDKRAERHNLWIS